MKLLYLDCGMGASGDMLTAALLELLPDGDAFVRELNALGIPGVHTQRDSAEKCGVRGTHVTVTVYGVEEHEHEHGHGGHSHSDMREIEELIGGLNLSQRVREDAIAVYRLIAEAESRAHGVPVTEVHFHEVGAADAIADVTAVCMLMERLAPERVVVSPVHVGCGQIRCAHGVLPVPAPATALLLRNVPIYGGKIRGELCTPTGAALLKYFADDFGDMPVLRLEAVGCGMGTKDFEAANCLRAFLGEAAEAAPRVTELCCNVDDMSAEELGFAMERLFEAGALEAYTLAAGMKKSRPGTVLCALCGERERESVVKAFFRHTSTIGLRETECRRYVMDRVISQLSTPWGSVRRKTSSGFGTERSKYEFEDLARIAREKGISLREAKALIGD